MFLVDGFPRNGANLEAWDSIMGEDVELKSVIYLTGVTEDALLKRIMKRAEDMGQSGQRVRNGD